MKPLGKFILIDIAKEAITPGGILLPDNIRNDYTAKVVAIGPEVTTICVGDQIAFRQGSMIYANKNHLIIKEEDVLALLDNE